MNILYESNVEYVDHMGSDLTVVNAARVSFNKVSTELTKKDEGLIKYLADHNHWTPFGHPTIILRLQTPIFVARQLVKHQIGFVWNEESRRYVDEEPSFYFPPTWRGRAKNAKQGSEGAVEEQDDANWHLDYAVDHALQGYKDLLAMGVAPEQARMVLPLNTMTQWVWQGSLAAWHRMCQLRLDPHAQKETQEVAEKVSKIIGDLYPVSWKALCTSKT